MENEKELFKIVDNCLFTGKDYPKDLLPLTLEEIRGLTVKKWEFIAAYYEMGGGEPIDDGNAMTCAFCLLGGSRRKVGCDFCPIGATPDNSNCGNTPYGDYSSELQLPTPSLANLHKFAQAEVEFLKNLELKRKEEPIE